MFPMHPIGLLQIGAVRFFLAIFPTFLYNKYTNHFLSGPSWRFRPDNTKEVRLLSHHNSKGRPDQRQRMLEAPVPPLICKLAVPTIISMLVTSLYNMADTYFVSQINTSASGAVGIVFSVMAIIQAFGFTVGTGAGSLASRLMGQGKRDEAHSCASSSVLFALVLGVALSALGLVNLDRLIWLLGSTDTIYPYARDYAWYILLGAPVMILSFTLNNLLRWQGQANLSVIGLTTGGILNIILDPLFIFGFNMGIGGAGAATLLSQCISLGILASFFLLGRSALRVSPALISRSPKMYYSIFKLGMPSLFRQGVASVSNMALNFNARLYGDAAVAALAIVGKVFMMIQSITIGFGQGFQPVLGYNYGAGKMGRVKEAIFFSLKICTVVLSTAAVIGFAFTPQIITFFRDDPLVIEIGVRTFRFQCFTLPGWPVMVFSNMLFQSLGKSGRATVLAICRHGLYIPLVFLMAGNFGLFGLEISQSIADTLTFLVSAIIMLHFFRSEFRQESNQNEAP